MLGMRDLFSVDHRLKLYLDMEVFEKAEEFKCFLKVWKAILHKVAIESIPGIIVA